MTTFNIIKSFTEAAQNSPEKIAVIDQNGDRETSYSQLEAMSRKIACYIISKNLPKSTLIPIILPAGLEYLAAELGVWMAGYAIVPISRAFSSERINYIIEECQATFVLNETEIEKAMVHDSSLRSVVEIDPTSDCAIFYTSGTTANPKGIMHTFESIDFTIGIQGKIFEAQATDIFVCGSPFYFVASLFYYSFLNIGATVHIYSEEVRKDVRLMEQYIKQHEITITFISPSALTNFHLESDKLRTVMTGSERLSAVEPGSYKLINLYGLTETAGPIMFFEVDKAYDNTPIGKPGTGVVVHILDATGSPVANGEPGEICMEGVFTKGYYKMEEATKQLYRGNVLHTGDIGMIREDGNVVYLNRNDWMVKINGQRVEPGEIEQAIKRIESIENAVVKGFVNDSGNSYLCAYYIATDRKIDDQIIREALITKLPIYMIPSYFVQMESFPINQNGKLDRKSLPAPDINLLRAKYIAPSNEIERRLCDAFAEVLKVEKIGVEDDFIHMGGDSIKVMTIQKLCCEIPLTTKMFYSGRTPRKIAELCAVQQYDYMELKDEYPLSQTQMGIYVECMNHQGEAVYNNPRLYKFEGAIDVNQLAVAIEKVIRAHPFVNTHITVNAEGEPHQNRADGKGYTQSVEEFSEAELKVEFDRMIQPFDLLADRLFRIRIFRTESSTYLFMDFHHIIYDGTSHGVLMADINAAYAGSKVEKETFSGFEVAAQEQILRQSELYDQAKEWYKETFGSLDLDSLPIADRNETQITFGRKTRRINIRHSDLQQFCDTNRITVNSFTTAAFGYTLGAYTNSNEALFATIYNGRTDIRSSRTVGMMVKTLPVYCKWDDGGSVIEFADSVKKQVIGSMNNDIFSFAEVCAQYGLSSKILFAYQGDLEFEDTLCGVDYQEIELTENATGEVFAIQLFRHHDNLTICAEYHSNLYSNTFVDQFMECYETIITGFTKKKRLNDVVLVSAAQQRELDQFNQTEMDYDRSQSIVSLFRKQVALTPENIAVIYKEKRYTYTEVDQISNRIAGYVTRMGLGQTDVVAILISRSEYMPIASIGALKTGCAYQPLDPTYPAERLNFMMKDSNAKLLIANRELRDIVSEYEGEVLFIEDIASLGDYDEPLPEVTPEDLFILLYTSGSTGVPKGCKICHSNLVAFCNWYQRYYELKPGDCVGAYASYGFDANMMDTYPALTCGATVCIVDEDIRLDLIALNEYFEANHVTHLFVTTQVGRQFAISVDNKSLKHLSIGGEKLVPLDPPSGYKFYNVYGPTEATIFTTAYPITSKEHDIPIGKPLTNMKLYVVDKYGRRLPVGAIGELWISGTQVSMGYLNRPEQTAYAYIENPFCDDKEYKRIYRSGDIVRYRYDGNLDFVGRRDSQVKIRGFRIELTEVEGVIREFEGVKDATVVAFDDPNGGKYIVAYIVGDAPIDIAQLNAFIEETKPPYMVPAVTMQIEAIPLNQNMKVNKRALPKPEVNLSELETEQQDNRPLNILECEIKDIVAQIVNSSNFGVTTNLAYMGLTSITSIKLSATLFKRFGVNIPSKQLVKGGSVHFIENEILKRLLDGNLQQSTTTTAGDVHNREQDAYPLSYSQQGVYYDCMKRPTEVIYNIPAMLSFDNSITAELLCRKVETIIQAHPYVMTRFEIRNGEVYQIREQHPIVIARENLSEQELEKYKKEFVRPFNLSKSPLYRLAVVQTERRVCLLVDFHHLIFDGASLDIFFNALKQSIEHSTVENETLSYFDYICDEQESRDNENFEKSRQFFHRQLSDCEGVSEITSDLNGNAEDGNLEEVVCAINAQSMAAYCKKHGVTPAALCLAGAFYTVSRYVNNKQVYLSTISNGRSDIRTSNTFGMFVKTLPLAAKIANQTAEEFVKQVADNFSETIENENYPFAQIAADYGFTPQIMYACQLGVLNDWSINGHRVEMESLELLIAKFKLSIHIEERDGIPSVVLQYNNALYSRSLMDGFARSMSVVIEQLASAPTTKVKHISMLDKQSREQIESFHEAGRAEIETKLLHHSLEKHATERPNHTALIAVDGQFTYWQMNEFANRIANGLINMGVKPQSRVALLLPRTSRVLFSMFGVTKSGSAYIPCDPDYPVERINHILDDSQAAYIITTGDRVADFKHGKAIDVELLLQTDNTENPNVQISPDDLAYLIYTSGSTGRPKGVMLHHRGICNYLTSHPVNQHVHAMTTTAHTTLSVTTVSFDMSLKELFTTLFNGLTLVFASEEQANDPILLAKLFEQTGADVFNATPSRMLQYMELSLFCKMLAQCKVIMCGGEKYADNLLGKLQTLTSARIFNTYGPTEITVSSNCKELTHETRISIGRPLLNYVEYIVDVDGNELPMGVVGELYIGGVGVARGYNNMDEMTHEKFIDYNGGRVYKSGDYAKWTQEGDVVILGRTDNQVKLRGLRIELGEIEAALTKIDAVKSVVVMIRKINSAEHLCAYFTAEHPIEIEYLKTELAKVLTQYMIPTAYLQLESMPLTPNGKTDLKALPEPQLSVVSGGESAANNVEQAFCDVFARILSLESVGATDRFFDLGGSSLMVTRVIIEASNAGYKISYGDVFKHSSPRALALLVKQQNQSETDTMITDYDYDSLQPTLENNSIDNFLKGESQPLGNVLITGATGYLGVHILRELIDNHTGKIFCLLRSKKDVSAMMNLKSILFYYFEQSYEELFGSRIFCVEGDVTVASTINSLKDNGIDTVINCAANVKHFSEGTDIEDVNIGGAQNLISFCLANSARLIHVSTMSVSGLSVNGFPKPGTKLTEKMLYFGQFMDNKYINSKFIAERLILENIQKNGLNAKIMRVGNLSARISDGEFQINYSTNSFMGRLKSYKLLQKCSFDQLDLSMEFSPIDEVAKVILLLSTTPKECCIFHPYNHHFILLGDIFKEMRSAGFRIDFVEPSEFANALTEAEKNPSMAEVLSSIIAYRDMAHGQMAISNVKDNTYTMQILYRMGYHWSITSWEYVTKFLQSLQGLGFFES